MEPIIDLEKNHCFYFSFLSKGKTNNSFQWKSNFNKKFYYYQWNRFFVQQKYLLQKLPSENYFLLFLRYYYQRKQLYHLVKTYFSTSSSFRLVETYFLSSRNSMLLTNFKTKTFSCQWKPFSLIVSPKETEFMYSGTVFLGECFIPCGGNGFSG